MSVVLPSAAQDHLDDFERLRDALCVFHEAIIRELPTATDAQREVSLGVLVDVVDRFDAAVVHAHRALARWHAGEIESVALCAVTGEPARIFEEAAVAVWYAAASES